MTRSRRDKIEDMEVKETEKKQVVKKLNNKKGKRQRI